MVAEGFSEMKTGMDKQFGAVNSRLDGVENGQAKLELRMGGLESQMQGLKTQMQGLEQNQEELKREFRYAATKFEVRELDKRVTRLEQHAKTV